MVDDRPEDNGSFGESSRPRREPPTIDLRATDVSSEPAKPQAGAQAEPASPESAPAPDAQPVSPQSVSPQPISPWAIAPVSGAVAAALVIGVGWVLGWPAVQAPTPAPVPQLNAAAIDDLTARIAGLETRAGKPVATDPATAARIEGIEKSLAALRGELSTTRVQAEKLTSAINDIRAAPRDGAAAAIDLSAVNERITKIEDATRSQGAEIAQQRAKIADIKAAEAKPADARPADDLPLRRLVASALLDVLVRVGDPYMAALDATKSLADRADALKPLDVFATSGVPNVNALCRELITIVPKLSPPQPENPPTTGTGIVDRLQAGAAKLVRIQRADAVGDDRGSIVARVTAAALRNDLAEARRELNTLSAADRAPAQAWLDKADARDAALATSRQYAADAMAALAQARQ
ncbi:MAG TPA: hypothetical protein VJS63_04880 [Bradyrhizobium sp.]|nr:hypothetical protein [Bradyrhizobium sp.]